MSMIHRLLEILERKPTRRRSWRGSSDDCQRSCELLAAPRSTPASRHCVTTSQARSSGTYLELGRLAEHSAPFRWTPTCVSGVRRPSAAVLRCARPPIRSHLVVAPTRRSAIRWAEFFTGSGATPLVWALSVDSCVRSSLPSNEMVARSALAKCAQNSSSAAKRASFGARSSTTCPFSALDLTAQRHAILRHRTERPCWGRSSRCKRSASTCPTQSRTFS